MAFEFIKKRFTKEPSNNNMDGTSTSSSTAHNTSTSTSTSSASLLYHRPPSEKPRYTTPYHQRDLTTWSSDDVCLWLSAIGLSEYVETFASNDITGEELIELQISDLEQIGVEKWGHRKKLMSKLQSLKAPPMLVSSSISSSPISIHSQGSMSNYSHKSSSPLGHHTSEEDISLSTLDTDEILIKCILSDKPEEDQIKIVIVSNDHPFETIMKRLKIEAGCDSSLSHKFLHIKFKDIEGDFVTLRNHSDFKAALRCSKNESFLKLWLTTSDSPSSPVQFAPTLPNRGRSLSNGTSGKKSSLRTVSILESLSDGAVIINMKGIITYTNKAMETLFGYSKDELTGNNISMLMPEPHASAHNGYIKQYLRTGKKRIIGTSRRVVAKRKDGKQCTVWLTVSEHHQTGGHGFIGLLHLASKNETNGNDDNIEQNDSLNENQDNNNNNNKSTVKKAHNTAEFHGDKSLRITRELNSVMKNLAEATLVTDQRGNVVYLNKAAETLLEFLQEELVGKSVKTIIPPAFVDHCPNMKEYISTGGSTVLGQAWDVVFQTKVGAMIPVTMSLSRYQKSEGTTFFVNIIRRRKISNDQSKSVLQQEREVIGNLALPGVIIDAQCYMQGFNEAASKLLGYTAMEVLGQNIKMLLPPGSHRDNHDHYVQKYIETGRGGIIGKTGRELFAQHKDGRAVPIWLSVTERQYDQGKRIFTGILHPRK